MLKDLGRTLFGKWFPDRDTYSTKIDIRKGRDSRQSVDELRTEVLYQPSSPKNFISRSFVERSLLRSKVELSEQEVIILEWLYKDNQYRCKYLSEFALSSERGSNIIFGPHDTSELSSGKTVNPFEDARIHGRLRKRNSWKHAISNPAETITKRKTFRSRQSSIRTASPLQANPLPIAPPALDKEDGENGSGVTTLAVGSGKQQLQNISAPQIGAATATRPSSNAAETYPYPRTLQFESAVVMLPENKGSGRTMVSGSGEDIETRHDSQNLTKQAVQNRPYSPVLMERFLESNTVPCENGNFIGLRDHFVLASVQENDDGDAEDFEQLTPQKKQEEFPDSESPSSKHPQLALQDQNKKAADFPNDYWQWDETRQKHYHRDEDTSSVVSYGPLD